MQEYISLFTQPAKVNQAIPYIINSVFNNPRCAFIIDTRLSIMPSVLPNIEFVHSYEQRILPLLGNSTVVVSEPFDPKLFQYTAVMQRQPQVISVPNNKNKHLIDILLSESKPEVLAGLRGKMVFPHLIDAPLDILANKIGFDLPCSVNVSQDANNKIKLKKYLLANNKITVPGAIVYSKLEAQKVITELQKNHQKIVTKIPFTVSGYGIDVFDSADIKIIDSINEYPVIIEGWLDVVASPSVQFFKSGSSVVLFALTDQILDGQHYMGNRMPSRFWHDKAMCQKIEAASIDALGWLEDCGYEGFGCVDLVVTNDNEVYPVEINARLTAAQYPGLTAFMLKGSFDCVWENIVIHFDKQESTSFMNKIDDLRYLPTRRFGVHPIVLGGTQYGVAQLLLIGDNTHDIITLKNELRRRLNYKNHT